MDSSNLHSTTDHDASGAASMDDPPHPVIVRHCDVAVVGGSAAGLAAALQLARQRRSVIVVDDGTPRNAPAAHMHGYLGRDGLPPTQLGMIGRAEVRSYGGEVLPGRVLTVRQNVDGLFDLDLSGGHKIVARRVLAATGVADELPDIDGLADHWGRGVISCPFCHGFEERDRKLVQIVTHPMGLHPTLLWRHLTAQLTVVLHDPTGIDAIDIEKFESAGVNIVRGTVRAIDTRPDGEIGAVVLADGRLLEADAVIAGSRFRARADVFHEVGLGTTTHASGMGDLVEVDPTTGQTAAAGIYAAGNLTDPTLQVLPAAAHGSRVGAMIAIDLAGADLLAGARLSGQQIDWDTRYGADDPVWSGNPNGTLVDQVSGLAPGRALDVGAGEGGDALWLAEQGWDVTASDISGNALDRVQAEANRRGLALQYVRADVNDLDPFGGQTYDLVSLQYGAISRTTDGRGLANLLRAVAPGGTLLIVGHDLEPLRSPVHARSQTRMYDPDAYVGVDDFAAELVEADGWQISLHETRPRPTGAVSTHHVDDVVLRATRDV